MKKNYSLLALILLSLCLAGIVVDRIIPAHPVQAAGEIHLATSSSDPSEKGTLPLTQPPQPAVMVVIGLVCVVFGCIAISPLVFIFPSRVVLPSGPGRIWRD